MDEFVEGTQSMICCSSIQKGLSMVGFYKNSQKNLDKELLKVGNGEFFPYGVVFPIQLLLRNSQRVFLL